MRKQKLKAQISLEFILILAITLSFLVLWLPVIIKTQNNTRSTISDFYIKKGADDIAYTADTLCILGEGNEREIVLITDKEMNITSANSKLFTVSNEAGSISKITKCKINISTIINKGRTSIILKNSNEVILIKQ